MEKRFFKIVMAAAMTAVIVGCGKGKSEEERLKEIRDSDSIAQVMREQAIADSLKREEERVIEDCNYTFEEALAGTRAPQRIINQLVLLDVEYYGIDAHFHKGQIVVNKAIEQDVRELFEFMKAEKFPIAKVIPVVYYDWSDDRSMEDNNSSGFNYRNADFSLHSNGMAIDINPYFNPQRWKGEWRSRRTDKPRGAVYDTARAGTFVEGSAVVEEFKKHGFKWGRYMSMKSDDHHFEKHISGILTQPEWEQKVVRDAEKESERIAEEKAAAANRLLEKPEMTINETSGEQIYTQQDEAYDLQQAKQRIKEMNDETDKERMINREVTVRMKKKSGRY